MADSGARVLRKWYGLSASLILSLATSLFVEHFVAPRNLAPVPRDVQLSGFHAPSGLRIDNQTVSGLGFMGDVLEMPKPPREIRVLTLGGSAFFNRNMAGRLASGLRKISEYPIAFVGGALREHTTWSSVLKYRALAKYQFDYVLIYHGINDLWANNVLPDEFEKDYSHLGSWYKRNPLLDRSLIARRVYNEFLYQRPMVYKFPTLIAGRFDNGANFSSVRTFRSNLATLIDAVRRAGGEPVFMTFAWSISDGYNLEAFLAGNAGYNNPEDYDSCQVELWGSQEHVITGLEKHNHVIRKLAESHNVFTIDQETLIGHDPEWFGDPVHLSEVGTTRFVNNVIQFFDDRAFLSRR